MPQFIPGTTLEYNESNGMFASLRPLIRATNGLTLSQVCAITGLEASTIQNWVKRGFVARPINKKYYERQLARILLISTLREAMPLDTIGELMQIINGSANDESDDIISEEDLYDCFCSVITSEKERIITESEVPQRIKSAVKSYNPPDKKAYETLTSALEVMAYAYISSQYKKLAKSKMEKLK